MAPFGVMLCYRPTRCYPHPSMPYDLCRRKGEAGGKIGGKRGNAKALMFVCVGESKRERVRVRHKAVVCSPMIGVLM